MMFCNLWSQVLRDLKFLFSPLSTLLIESNCLAMRQPKQSCEEGWMKENQALSQQSRWFLSQQLVIWMISFWTFESSQRASQVVLVVKSLPANAGDFRDKGSIPGLERSPGGGHMNPLQYSCQENPTERGAWWATVHRVAKGQTQIKRLSTA